MDERKFAALIDTYGLTHDRAKWVADHTDSKTIFTLIAKAYSKGRSYDAEMWRGSSGGY